MTKRHIAAIHRANARRFDAADAALDRTAERIREKGYATLSQLRGLARGVMAKPVVEVRKNPEGVWVAKAIDFGRCAGVEVHCTTKGEVTKALAGALLSMEGCPF